MANKKTKNQLDSIRGDVAALTEAVWALRDQLTVEAAAAAAARSTTTARERADGNGRPGPAALRWEDDEGAPNLAALDDEGAAQVLSALGHRQRLGIVKALVARPASAADLVEGLNLGTTGAAYHHLNVLLAANLVVQQSRGVYTVDERRLPALRHLLAATAATIDPILSPEQWHADAVDDAVLAERSSI